MSTDMYRENILDHYRNPRNSGEIAEYDIHISESNPMCGDVVDWYAKVEDGKITTLRFRSSGCAISQAASSMLAEELEGKSLDEVSDMENEELFELLGIDLSPMRIKCALLGLEALKKAILLKKAEEAER